MLHNFEEIERSNNLVYTVFFVNFTSNEVELYLNGCSEYISGKRINL